MKGKLVQWFDDKGYGFISGEGGNHIFVHISAFVNRHGRPVEMETVSYDLEQDDRGRPRARNAEILQPPSEADLKILQDRRIDKGCIVFAVLFWTVILGLYLAHRIPGWLALSYPIAGALTALMYVWDKARSQSGEWRVPEKRLHLLELLGGWPMALIMQRMIHHKSRKLSYQVIFWLAVLLNISVVAYQVVKTVRF